MAFLDRSTRLASVLSTLDSGEDMKHLINGFSHEVSMVVTMGH